MVDYLERNIAEFASRWRRELAPDQVKIGKQLSKEKSKSLASINSGKEKRLVNGGYKSLTNVNNKIDQISNTAKAQKASLNLLAGNKADPLIKQNKNLRSYLENRKVKQGTNSNVLSKPYQAPKTIKRAARKDANVFQKGIRDSPQRLAEIKAKQPRIPQLPPPKYVAPKDIPNPLNTLKSNPVATSALSKPKLPNKKFLTSKRIGIGLGVAGATALGAGIYNRMKKNKNK